MPAKDYFGNLGSNVIGGAFNGLSSVLLGKYNASLNYKYGEMAAEQADKRQRALYEDYLSPAARIMQLKEAGLSPSLFADGAGGGSMGLEQGAQGTGASGMGLPTGVISPESLAQIELLKSQTRKNDAQTQNLDKDTDLKVLQENLEKMKNTRYKNVYNITMSAMQKDGKQMSMFEFAREFNNYEKFAEHVRSAMTLAGDNEGLNSINSEDGQQTLRQVFLSAHSFNSELAAFKANKVNADFATRVTNAMNTEEFAKANADAALKSLQAAAATSALTESQRNAWNDVIERLKKWNATAADIVIVVSMILNNAMSHYNMPNFNSYETKNIIFEK